MDPRLRLVPERRLVMTVALKQALEILQMPAAELCPWLLNEIDRNPLLELIESPAPFRAISSHEAEAAPTLYEHLQAQIRETFVEPEALQKAEILLHQIDEKGYLEGPIPEGFEEIISKLQTFDPPGIFARDLQECLLIQLQLKNLTDTPTYLLVRDFFFDLLQRRYAKLQRHFTDKEFKSSLQKISQLSLRPASRFQSEPVPIAFADVRFVFLDNHWKVEIPDDLLPSFKLVSYSLENISEEEKVPVREWTTAGKWICRTLQRRKRMLLEIGAYLVKKQGGYLNHKKKLSPLTLQQVAEELKLHVSTLSRALAGKYADTPRGLIPLRSLITSSPERASSKEILHQLISQEKEALTDAELAQELSLRGIKVARRTVAKYRKELKIGSVRGRPYSCPKAALKSKRAKVQDKEAPS